MLLGGTRSEISNDEIIKATNQLYIEKIYILINVVRLMKT